MIKKFSFKLFFSFILLSSLAKTASAQTPTDGILMEKTQVCAAAIYNHDSWKEYWEATLLRENGNIGTITTQSAMPMVAAGITKNLNLIVALPYVWTEASQGTLKGQKGFQDFSLWAKYRFWQKTLGAGDLHLIGTGGVSTPASKYANDYLPLGLGLGARTASLRGIAFYHLKKGPYANLQWGYTWRGDIKIERDFYWSNGPHYTNEVIMPNMIDYSASIGWLNSRLKVDLSYNQMITQSGADIRRQDMPFPSYRMILGRASAFVQYYFSKPKGLSVIGQAGQCFSGRNMGKATNFGGGLAYQFGWKKAAK